MKRIPIIPLVLLASILLAPSARATVLVYEGFSPTDYSAGSSLKDCVSARDSIGLDIANGWMNKGTAVYKSMDGGLSLPTSWTDSGTVHGTQDYRCVLTSGTAFNNSQRANRAQQRELTCTWPTSGSVYFRFLMKVPKACLSTSYFRNWDWCLGGLGTIPIDNPATDSCNFTDGVYMGIRNKNGTLEVLSYTRPDGGELASYVFFNADTSKDLNLVCVAKIDIGENGNDTLSMYATTVDNWNDEFEWTETISGLSLISGSNALRYLQMIGPYKTNSNQISFDEFIVTTEESEAYYRKSEAAPTLGDVTLSHTGTGAYSITAEMVENEGNLYWIADDGISAPSTNLLHNSTVAAGETATGTITGLTGNRIYRITVLAKNTGGMDLRNLGTLYTGALALGATTNARETDLVPGGVVVSRASTSPLPLTVNYTISGPPGSEGSTWRAPVPVTIPADESDAILPVVPLSDSVVNENIAITVALAAGNYEIPSTSSARLMLFNRNRFVPEGFWRKIVARPSLVIQDMLDGSSLADFPALLRLPAAASAQLRTADGTDLFIVDENDAPLPFEVETFAPDGTTLVWVKVPELSADTELTAFLAGSSNVDNDPAEVWSDFAGVWHFAPSCAGTTTIPDATGNGFDATTTNQVSSYEGPGGLGAIQGAARIDAPDYDSALTNGVAKFSASGWFKAPTQVSSWWTVAHKKVGLSPWNIDKGWYFQMPQSPTMIRFTYIYGADINIPDVTQNWNYFHIVSDGSKVRVYMNGNTAPSADVSYTIKASETDYMMCPAKGCAREYRIRRRAASAKETALEYASMADAEFFVYSDVVRAGRRGVCILIR